MNKITYLINSVQEYVWGSPEVIPAILGEEPDGHPKAELWMGAHPKAPSMVSSDGKYISLSKLIEGDAGIVGDYVEKRFGKKLPFLFKVIAADTPLSIQAHPNLSQAKEGFAEENRRAVPIDSPERNYPDDNHKPEIICAVTKFWIMAGFRDIAEIISLLEDIKLTSLAKEVDELAYNQNRLGLRKFFRLILEFSPTRKKELIDEVVKLAAAKKGTSPIFDWILKLNYYYPGDIGVISPLLLNLVLLNPGEALFLEPGEFHTYLRGVGMELMANSDNLLRGGLTTKHVDLPELLKVLSFNYGPLKIISPQAVNNAELAYEKCADEFSLSIITLNGEEDYVSPPDQGVEIMICIEGDTHITQVGDKEGLGFDKGKVVLIPSAVEGYKISGLGKIYKASVPR
ncbi:MAG: mannose-6-phosphate isomerase, class I [Nitrospinota bacterium]|nr:mannose-6-phosphate isomerase, class I [Nitrospinota bacterium]